MGREDSRLKPEKQKDKAEEKIESTEHVKS
jgi:hypothetical protein